MEDEQVVRLRFDLAYDGTEFSGWAKQPGLRTVQGEFERALEMLMRSEPASVQVTVGGRTDAGVHARGQVCHLDVTAEQLHRFVRRPEILEDGTSPTLSTRGLNGILRRNGAGAIVVHRVARVPVAFDARFSALSRRYEYRLRPANAPQDPLTRFFTANVPNELDISLMQAYSASLVGLRDFATFCKAREGATTIRTLTAFEWTTAPDGVLVARVEADAFCHSMVRSLIGAVVAVGSGRLTVTELDALVADRKRSSHFTVMPAHGLSLEEIRYPAEHELAARALQTRAKRLEVGD